MSTTMNNNSFSVFIHYSRPDVPDNIIADLFRECQIGEVDRVDRVNKMDNAGKQYQALYVHFSQVNYESQGVISINNGEKLDLYYSEDEYWVLQLNKAKKHTSGERKIRIQIEDEEQQQPIAPTLPAHIDHNLIAQINIMTSEFQAVIANKDKEIQALTEALTKERKLCGKFEEANTSYERCNYQLAHAIRWSEERIPVLTKKIKDLEDTNSKMELDIAYLDNEWNIMHGKLEKYRTTYGNLDGEEEEEEEEEDNNDTQQMDMEIDMDMDVVDI